MHCATCGAVVSEGAKFCTACGAPVLPAKHTAAVLRRFFNLILDWLFSRIILVILSFFLAQGILASDYPTRDALIAVAILTFVNLGYYVIFESIWQRTPGKWATHTKVIKLDGTKPGFWRIVGRTLCRYIPFEAISFLFGEHPWGWHDRISGTMVVPAEYSVVDAASIDRTNKGHSSAVVIVVAVLVALSFIAFIGILSSIVLVSLNTARNKGADVRVISDLNQARAEMEVNWTRQNGYQGGCDDAQTKTLLADAGQNGGGDSANVGCYADANEYIMVAPLKSGNYFCVDSKPTTGTITGVDTATSSCEAMPGFAAQ